MNGGLTYKLNSNPIFSEIIDDLRNRLYNYNYEKFDLEISRLIIMSTKSYHACNEVIFILSHLLNDEAKPFSEKIKESLIEGTKKYGEIENGISIKKYTDLDLILMTTPPTELSEGTKLVLTGLEKEAERLYLNRATSQGTQKAIDLGTGGGHIAIAIAKLGIFSRVEAHDRNRAFENHVYINSWLNSVNHVANFVQTDISKSEDYETLFANCDNIGLIASNSTQRAVLNESINLDYTKQYAPGDNGLKFTEKTLRLANSIKNKDAPIYLQLLDWHNGREIELFEKFNLKYKIILESEVPIKKIPNFPLRDFAEYEEQYGINYLFKDATGKELTARQAMKLYSSDQEVYTKFRFIRLTKI